MWAEDLVLCAQEQLNEEGDAVFERLWARGVSNEQIQHFSLGFLNKGSLPCECDPGFVEWAKKGTSLEETFVLPLTNTLGKVRGFQFRSIYPERKGYRTYLVSKDEPVLFGLSQAMPHVWRSRKVFLVEGVFDLFPVQRVVPWVLPTLTASVSGDLFRLLKRLVDYVWVGYDGDSSGRRGAQFATSLFEGASIPVYVVRFPTPSGVKDPSDLWGIWGTPRFEQFLKEILDGNL